MILAGWLGHYMAQITTKQINNELTQLIAGIVIGLLVGIGVGILVNRTWARMLVLTGEAVPKG